MASLKYRWQAIFDNLRLISAHWAEQKEEEKKRNAPRKIQLNFVCSLVLGQGRKERDISPEMAEVLGLNWKCKVVPEIYQALKSQGLVVGSVCDIRAVIDNYGSNEAGGTWFSFRQLLKLNGQPRNWSPVHQIQSSSFDELEGLETEINSELEEVA